MQDSSKVYATVRILPVSYGTNHNCDHNVISRRHISFQTTMMTEKLDEIKQRISSSYKDGVSVSQTKCDDEIVLTLAYHPDNFHLPTDLQPFHDFVSWVENLWREALADFRRCSARNFRI